MTSPLQTKTSVVQPGVNLTVADVVNLEGALGATSTPHQQKCYQQLQTYLNRIPTPQEVMNMSTDANIQAWALAM